MKKYTLPKEFAEKWISALRGGEYRQGVEILHNEDHESYCCLGVACKLYNVPDYELAQYGEIFELSREEDASDLTGIFGLPIEIINGKLPSMLIHLNDDERLSFEQIANWIEQNVEFV